MPAGTVISGTDGRVELRTEAGSAIGELPRVKSWSLDATAAVSERGGRVMASNDDGPVPAVAAKVNLILSSPDADDTFTIGSETYVFKTSPSAAFEVGLSVLDGDTLDNIRDAINDDSSLFSAVRATIGAGEAVVITALEAGAAGNDLDATSGLTGVSFLDASGAGTVTFFGGADATTPPWTARRAISRSWSGSVEFEWQESQSIPASLQVDPSKVGQTIQVKFYPHDDASGRVVYSGIARIAGVSQPAEVDGNLMASVDFTGNGALTYDTVS